MSYPRSKLEAEQIAKLVYDEAKQGIRISGDLTATVAFPAEQSVEIDATDGDSIIIAGTTDGTLTGPVKAIRTLADGTVVVSGGTSGGSFTEINPTDFRAATLTASTTATAISFPGFTPISVSIYSLPENQVPIRIGKSDINSNYFLLTPGSSISLPLQMATTAVYYVLDSPGVAKISLLAMGN